MKHSEWAVIYKNEAALSFRQITNCSFSSSKWTEINGLSDFKHGDSDLLRDLSGPVETCGWMLRLVETCKDLFWSFESFKRPSKTYWDLLRPVGVCWDLLMPVNSGWDLSSPFEALRRLSRPVETCWDLLWPGETCWDLLRPVINRKGAFVHNFWFPATFISDKFWSDSRLRRSHNFWWHFRLSDTFGDTFSSIAWSSDTFGDTFWSIPIWRHFLLHQ